MVKYQVQETGFSQRAYFSTFHTYCFFTVFMI
jgi:hypothetical protein